MPDQTELAWYHADEGVLPTAARQPWTLLGAAVLTLPSTGGCLVTAAATQGGLVRQFFESDVVATPARQSDRVELQWRMKGLTTTPAWASGLSTLVGGLDDGRRVIGVSIGSELRWINPYTGADLGLIASKFPWLRKNDFHLIKDRSSGWILLVNGREVARRGYFSAPTNSTLRAPRYILGHADAAGSSTSVWYHFEAGLNRALPPQWKVDRLMNAAPPKIQAVWNETWRAYARMFVGMGQEVINAMEVAWPLITAARLDHESAAWDGSLLPSLSQPDPWTMVDGGSWSTVRDRQRIATGAIPSTANYGFVAALPQAEIRAAATFITRSYVTTDPAGRTGAFLEVRNGHRVVRAECVEVTPGQVGWVITEGTDAGPIPQLGTTIWLVDEEEPHRVELKSRGRDRNLLLVDGARVDVVLYSSATVVAATWATRIGRNGQATIASVVDIEHAEANVRYTDLMRREFFLTNVSERLVFAGGCERNDHLDTLMRSHYELQGLRGTRHNLLLEIKRLSCCPESKLVDDTTSASWYLEHSYPETTPIYLEGTGNIVDVYVELHDKSPNFTAEDLARTVRTYLTPISTVEVTFHIASATLLTAIAAAGTPATFTVALPVAFDVGDNVELRDVANVVKESTTIDTINKSTGAVQVASLASGFAIGDTMRKVLFIS